MRRLLRSALLLAVVCALGAAASARADGPRATDFEQRLDGGRALARAAAAGDTWRSGTIRAPRRFDLVGFRWSAPAEVDGQIRTRGVDGRWTGWTRLGHNHGARPGSDAVWSGASDAYQLRLTRRPRGLRAHFVRVTGTARVTARRAQAGRPAIVPRAAWGAEQCTPRSDASYGSVDAGFVHHTVNTNAYTPEQAPAIVLAICRFHRNSNGWNDLGYNFLVDRFGRIYEGRAGGTDQAVIGAQAQGYNATTTSVANIGTFSSEGQTPAGLRATADLLAWKLSLHGTPVAGAVTIPSAGGPQNRYPVGTPVLFQRITAHRDGDVTECPGAALYAQLPELRRIAAERAPAYGRAPAGGVQLSVTRSRVTYPQPAALSGRVTAPDGSPRADAPVAIQIRSATGASFSTVARTTTGSDGRWSATLASSRNRTVRAAATVDGGLVFSRTRAIRVVPTVEARLSARRLAVKGRLVVRGRTRPRTTRIFIEVARKTAKGYRVVAQLPRSVRNGRYSYVVRPQRAALTRVRVVTRADARNDAGRSRAVYVRVITRAAARTGGTGSG